MANAAGTVIASTLPALRGREIGDRDWQQAARRGDPWAGLPGPQELTGRVGMPLAFPIRASFDRGRTVGVIVAVLDWPSVVEILNGVKVVPEGQSERGFLILADSSGVVLSAPSFFTGWQPGKTGLTSLGLEAVQSLPATAAAGNVTFNVRDAPYLAGYATTERQAYVPGTWRTVLLMRADVAFAPLRRLMWTIIILSISINAYVDEERRRANADLSAFIEANKFGAAKWGNLLRGLGHPICRYLSSRAGENAEYS